MSLPAIQVRGVTKSGEMGMRHLFDSEANAQAWIANGGAAELLDDGYVRAVVEPYVPTVIVGDKSAHKAPHLRRIQ